MWTKLFRRYRVQTSGNVALITAILMPVMLAIIGAAVDSTRLHSTAMKLQDMSDNAALAAANGANLTSQDQKRTAESALARGHASLDSDVVIKSEVVEILDAGDTVSVVVTVDVPQFLGQFLGKGIRQVQRASVATRIGGDDIPPTSIVFVLDASGSMNARMGSSSRIDTLKTSIRDVFSEFDENPDSAEQLRTGIYAYNWGIRDEFSRPLSDGWTQTIGKVNTMGLGNATIPTQALEVTVSDLMAEPNSLDGRPRKKIIVFMTDGEVDDHLKMKHKNSRYHPYYGYNGSFTDRIIKACEMAQQNGISIIAVGMDAPRDGREVLEDCITSANNPDSLYLNATDAGAFERSLRLAIPDKDVNQVRLVR